MPEIECLDCGTEIGHPGQSLCPVCGSGDRRLHLRGEAAIAACGLIKVKKYHNGMSRTKGWYETRIAGGSQYQGSGEWNRLERTIDHANNHYYEHIEDRRGNVLMHCNEPLDEHRGHGSAKHNR